MKIKIVYFAYLAPDKWEKIVVEQLDSLKKIDLYDIASNIYMSVISDDIEIEKLKILLKNNYSKIEIKNIYKENVYEYPGLKTIYQIAEDDDDTYLLYFHSKGMTSNQHETRQYMFKYTIENYKEGIRELIKNKDLEDTRSQEYNTSLERHWLLEDAWYRTASIRWCRRLADAPEDPADDRAPLPSDQAHWTAHRRPACLQSR
jgi:hypothetical protein